MNLLDENIRVQQRRQLESWRIAVKQVGVDFGVKGLKDPQIVVLLQGLRKTTFFTRDADYDLQSLCHSSYCLVSMNVPQNQVATSVLRFLRHPDFDTHAKRMGSVVRLSHHGLSAWRVGSHLRLHTLWANPPR